MSGTLRLRGATSGYSELQAPAVAADQTFVLPTAGGTLLTTDSPVPKLTLELGSASQPSLTFEGDTDTGLYSSGTNTLNLVTGGSDRLVLDSSGRVGINTTSPSKILDVNGTFRVTGESQFDADIYRGGDPQLGVEGTALFDGLITVRNNFSSNSVFRGQVVGSTDYKIDLRANGDAHFLGNVGIGTTSPGVLLDLGTSTPILRFSDSDTTGYHQIQSSNSNFIINADPSNADTGSAISFKVDNSDAMRIDSSGNVGIGESNPVSKLVIKNTSSNDGIRVISSTTGEGFVLFGDTNDNNTGGIIYNHTNDALEFNVNNSERMRIDSSGNVGIGTTPAANRKVHIQGTGFTELLVEKSDATTAAIMLAADSGVGSIYTRSTESTTTAIPLTFHTGNNERMRIDSSGNVQIRENSNTVSTGASLYLYDLAGSANSTNSSGRIAFYSSDLTDGASIRAEIANLYENSSADSALTFKTYNGSLGERMRIDSAGRVGIGLSNPGDYSGVSKDLVVGNHSGARGITIAAQSNNTGYLSWADGTSTTAEQRAGRIAYSHADDSMRFDTAASERMRIQNSGRVLIGNNTSATIIDGNSLVEMSKTSGNVIIYGNSESIANGQSSRIVSRAKGTSSRSAQIGVYKHSGITNCAAFLFIEAQNGTDNYYWPDDSNNFRTGTSINSVGTTNGTVVGTQTSDERLKNVGAAVPYGLAEVKQLQPKQYALKTEPDTNKLGFIAQEVESIIPEAVFDTREELEGHEDGDRTKLGMEYVQLIPVLVNAIKELSEKVETLEQRLTDAGL